MPTFSFFVLAAVMLLAFIVPSAEVNATVSRGLLTFLAGCSLPVLSCWWGRQLSAVHGKIQANAVQQGQQALWLLWLVLTLVVLLFVQWPQTVRSLAHVKGWAAWGNLLTLAPIVLPLWLSRWVYAISLTHDRGLADSNQQADLLLQNSMRSRFELVALVLPALVVLSGWQTMAGTVEPWKVGLAGGVVIFGLLILYPKLLCWAWRLRPLSDEKLKVVLAELTYQSEGSSPTIFSWPQGSHVSAAAAVGSSPWGMIVLGDHLISHHCRQTVRTVFAHEWAHLRNFHVAWRLLAVLSIWPWGWAMHAQGWVSIEWLAAIGALFTLGLLSHTARRLEHDADLSAAELLMERTPEADANQILTSFQVALKAMASPRELHRGGWLHPSVSARIKFLAYCLNHPRARQRFRHQLRFEQIGLIVLCLSGWIAAICC